MRPDIKERYWDFRITARMSNGFPKQLRFSRIERHEFAAIPIRLEFRDKLLQDMRQVLCGDFQVPLEPAGHRRVRHVRRTDISRRIPGIPVKVVRLCVQPGSVRIV